MMKYFFIFLVFIFSLNVVRSQNLYIDSLEVDYYSVDDFLEQTIVIESKFGLGELHFPEIPLKQVLNIVRVDYCYSKSLNSKYDQDSLNMVRMRNLLKKYSRIDGNEMVTWRMVKQTGQDVSLMFHGFILYYREFHKRRDDQFFYNTLLGIHPQEVNTPESIIDLDSKIDHVLLDTSVFNGLNKSSLDDQAIVCDLTLSMAPYFTQLFLWLKKSENVFGQIPITFFNDGDNKKDSEKRIGTTGGVHSFQGKSSSELLFFLERLLEKGTGGDIQENDMESIIATIEKNRGLKRVLIIADNFSKMRDYALIGQVKIPVDVILCGNQKQINPQYLDLARSTHGILYHNNQKVSNLDKIEKGMTITINGIVYEYQKEGFLRKGNTLPIR